MFFMRETPGSPCAEGAAHRSAGRAGEDDARHSPRVPVEREGRSADHRRRVPPEELRGDRGSGASPRWPARTIRTSACSTATPPCRTWPASISPAPTTRPAPATRPAAGASLCATPARRRTRFRAPGRSSRTWFAGRFAALPRIADLESLLSFYQQARTGQGTSTPESKWPCAASWPIPNSSSAFEPPPADVAPNAPYRISDTELASRLSFFLWSSIPDDELLNLADSGQAARARRPRAADAPHAGRSAVARAGDQLRGPVAVSARSEERQSRFARVSRFRRQSAPGVPAGNGNAV